MAAADFSSWKTHPLNSMAKPVVARFVKDCMGEFAESLGLSWAVSPSDDEAEDHNIDTLVEDEYDPLINDGILRYIEMNKDIFDDHFKHLVPRVRTQSEFEYCVLVEIATSEFKDGYSHAAFLRFITWAMYLAFNFYKIGKKLFPKAAMYVIADTLDHYLASREFNDGNSFVGLTTEASNFMFEKENSRPEKVTKRKRRLAIAE